MFKVRRSLIFICIAILAACKGGESTQQPTAVATSTQTKATLAPTETATARPTLAADEWKSLPIVPTVSATARKIYQRGIEMGNDPRAFSKVGDCQTSTDFFLMDFDHPGKYVLGKDYAGLQPTIDYYQGSFSRQSLAVKDGFNVASVLSPLRADPAQCEKGENPLACEFRLHHPSVALISMETNFNQRTADDYGKYMRQIVEYSISQGVVPILATKADNLEGNNSINAEIAMIANEYDIPMWNFWLAVQPLPEHGLDPGLHDGFHISYDQNFFDNPKTMLHAWPWRNLTALQTLDAIRRGLTE